jgi:hypothetical protein
MTFLNLLVEIAFAASRLDIEGPWSDRTFGREVEDAVEAGRGLLDAVRRPMNIALHPTWRPVCKDCCLPSWDESWVLWMQRHFDYSNYSCPELWMNRVAIRGTPCVMDFILTMYTQCMRGM